MKVLVTGAAGYLGANIVKVLAGSGYRVRGTVRDLSDEDKVGFLKEEPRPLVLNKIP